MEAATRPAIVTGAAQGIGAALARALHGAGHPVALVDRATDRIAAMADELSAAGAPALAVTCDMRDRAAVFSAVAQAAEAHGPAAILVNNAARTQARDFLDVSAEEWDDVLATNLRGHLFAAQAVLPGMIAAGWGRIVNLASVAGQRGGPQVQGPHYAASKAGIIGLTRYIAHLFAPQGITCNAIAPGPILTEQTALAPPDKLAAVAATIPLGRIGDVKNVAGLLLYLVSDAGDFTTGATLDVNGGMLMR